MAMVSAAFLEEHLLQIDHYHVSVIMSMRSVLNMSYGDFRQVSLQLNPWFLWICKWSVFLEPAATQATFGPFISVRLLSYRTHVAILISHQFHWIGSFFLSHFKCRTTLAFGGLKQLCFISTTYHITLSHLYCVL